MSDKQAVLDAIGALPDDANWAQITVVLLDLIARRRAAPNPVTDIPGVDPAEVWEAAAQADAGKLTPHADVFAKLRVRP